MTNGPMVSTPRQFGSLEFTLSATKAVYKQGEPVKFVFSVRNTSSQVINATGSGCIVLSKITQGNTVVGPEGGLCPGAGYIVPLSPGETKSFEDTWLQTNVQGNQVAPGQYTVIYWLTAGQVDTISLTQAEAEQHLAANPIEIALQTQ